MTRDPLADFTGIRAPGTTTTASEHYPGSKKKRRAVTGEPQDWWSQWRPNMERYDLRVKGQDVTFYTIAVLAAALGRKSPALRKWERLGYLPQPRFHTPGRTVHGQRRLYTRELIEGIVRIATEEGLVGDANRNVSATRFEERVRKLFKELNA